MRRWIGRVLLAVLAAGLFGCSASGPRFSEMAGSMPSLGENDGRIYFYRNSIMGSGVQPEVTVNGQAVGRSRPNSFFYIDRPPGTYRASARTEAEGTIDIVLRPKQTAYVLMSMNLGIMVMRPSFERVSESEGRREMQSLAYDDEFPETRIVRTAVLAAAPANNAAEPTPAPAAVNKPVATASAVTAAPLAPSSATVPRSSTPVPPANISALPARVTASAPPEATPFAKTSLNDLRLLLPANR